ncbi:MAG TPA: DUF4136 domain-containing protein [Steroidobacteraceae bacterium]|nr:DUF4136 domain-containing protein [Steroidobacteraceae bacterium]
MVPGMRITWVALVAMAAGCAVHWDVETYAVPGADVASRETWFWKGGDFAGAEQIEPAVIAAAESHVRAAVTEELTRKGYREASSAEAADLVASYQVSGMRRFVVDETPRIGAPSPNTVLSPSEMQPPPASSVPREVSVREGSVILFLDDPRLGKLAWRGEVAEQIRAGSPEKAGRIIAQMAREIAKEVPVRKGR